METALHTLYKKISDDNSISLDKEQVNKFNIDLDYKISTKKITESLLSLKNNKQGGIDLNYYK